MGKKKELNLVETEALEIESKKKVLSLDGQAYVDAITGLYNELSKEISKLEKETDELSKSIVNTFEIRLEFIKEAWSDSELTKEEKTKIYNDYLDTAKAYQQYQIDRVQKKEAKLEKKSKIKDIILYGSVIISVGIPAITKAAKFVIEYLDKSKN